MNDVPPERAALRLELRERRAGLSADDQAAAAMAVMARLARVPRLRSATVIAGYRAIRGEVDIDATLALLDDTGALVTVPRVVGEHMEFVAWRPDAPSAPGVFGIPEPVGADTVALNRHDVVLAPLVAFDHDGNRLGQGGGYYDRALAPLGEDRPVVIGIAHSFQRVAEIPAEPWDIPLDAVVTEDGVYEFRAGALDPGI